MIQNDYHNIESMSFTEELGYFNIFDTDILINNLYTIIISVTNFAIPEAPVSELWENQEEKSLPSSSPDLSWTIVLYMHLTNTTLTMLNLKRRIYSYKRERKNNDNKIIKIPSSYYNYKVQKWFSRKVN